MRQFGKPRPLGAILKCEGCQASGTALHHCMGDHAQGLCSTWAPRLDYSMFQVKSRCQLQFLNHMGWENLPESPGPWHCTLASVQLMGAQAPSWISRKPTRLRVSSWSWPLLCSVCSCWSQPFVRRFPPPSLPSNSSWMFSPLLFNFLGASVVLFSDNHHASAHSILSFHGGTTFHFLFEIISVCAILKFYVPCTTPACFEFLLLLAFFPPYSLFKKLSLCWSCPYMLEASFIWLMVLGCPLCFWKGVDKNLTGRTVKLSAFLSAFLMVVLMKRPHRSAGEPTNVSL